jgi:hypothetical protein
MMLVPRIVWFAPASTLRDGVGFDFVRGVAVQVPFWSGKASVKKVPEICPVDAFTVPMKYSVGLVEKLTSSPSSVPIRLLSPETGAFTMFPVTSLAASTDMFVSDPVEVVESVRSSKDTEYDEASGT